MNYLFSIGYVLVCLMILVFLEIRWPLSNLGAFLLFIGFFAAVLVLFVGKEYLLSKKAARKQRKGKERLFGKMLANPIVLEAGTLIILLLTIFFFDRFLPHDISLNDPGKVKDTSLISGRVIDESWSVYVLIRPIDSSGTFVEKATGPDGDKNWSAICYFGGGSGKQFYIRAVAISNDKMKTLGNSPGAEEIEKQASVQSRMYRVTKE